MGISEQTAIISLCSINWLVCIAETESVYCAVRTGSLIQLNFILQKFKQEHSNYQTLSTQCQYRSVYTYIYVCMLNVMNKAAWTHDVTAQRTATWTVPVFTGSFETGCSLSPEVIALEFLPRVLLPSSYSVAFLSLSTHILKHCLQCGHHHFLPWPCKCTEYWHCCYTMLYALRYDKGFK